MKLKSLLAMACILGSCYTANAHEFLIKPNISIAEKGKDITVDVVETHVFIQPEELPILKDTQLFSLQGKNPAKAVALEAVTKEKLLRGHILPVSNEDIVILGKRLPQFWSNTTEGILEGDRKALEAQGKKVLSVGTYEKYALVFIPGKDTKPVSTYTIPGEQPPLLIMPSFNPNMVKVGEPLTVTVTLNGKPVPNAPISATYDGFSKEESVYAMTMKADDKGTVTFTPKNPGFWIVHTETTEKSTDPKVDEKNIRSSILFWVK